MGGLDGVDRVEHDHALADLRRVVGQPALAVRAPPDPERRHRHGYLFSSMICCSSAGIGGIGTRVRVIAPSAPFCDHEVEGAELVRLGREVLAELRPPALLALDGGRRDGFGDGQQVAEVDRGVPAVVVFAVAADPGAPRARPQALEPVERLAHLRLAAHDADQVLHHVLQVVLDRVRVLAGWRRDRTAPAPRRVAASTCCWSMRRRLMARRELRGVLAGALAEHEQVRQRVATQAVGAVEAGGGLAGGKQARHRGHLRVAVHANPAHRVVRRRPDLHRLLGDVEVGQLLELVVHARQLPLDVLGGVRELLLDPRDVEEHAAVRAPAPGLDLAVDAARDVVARQQLRRAAGRLVALRVAPALLLVVGRRSSDSSRECRRT